MDTIAMLQPVCSADTTRPMITTPFLLLYEGRRWAVGTDGRCIAALPYDGELRSDGPDAAKVIPSAPPTHKASVAALLSFAGKPEMRQCEACGGSASCVRYCCDATHPCGMCHGEGSMKAMRYAGLLDGHLNPDFLLKILATAPEGIAEVTIVHAEKMGPFAFRAPDWIRAYHADPAGQLRNEGCAGVRRSGAAVSTGICTAHPGRHPFAEGCVQWNGSEETRLREERGRLLEGILDVRKERDTATARSTAAESALAEARGALRDGAATLRMEAEQIVMEACPRHGKGDPGGDCECPRAALLALADMLKAAALARAGEQETRFVATQIGSAPDRNGLVTRAPAQPAGHPASGGEEKP